LQKNISTRTGGVGETKDTLHLDIVNRGRVDIQIEGVGGVILGALLNSRNVKFESRE
jgi:hypothetical protein